MNFEVLNAHVMKVDPVSFEGPKPFWWPAEFPFQHPRVTPEDYHGKPVFHLVHTSISLHASDMYVVLGTVYGIIRAVFLSSLLRKLECRVAKDHLAVLRCVWGESRDIHHS